MLLLTLFKTSLSFLTSVSYTYETSVWLYREERWHPHPGAPRTSSSVVKHDFRFVCCVPAVVTLKLDLRTLFFHSSFRRRCCRPVLPLFHKDEVLFFFCKKTSVSSQISPRSGLPLLSSSQTGFQTTTNYQTTNYQIRDSSYLVSYSISPIITSTIN